MVEVVFIAFFVATAFGLVAHKKRASENKVMEKAKAVLSDIVGEKFAVIDFETTGLDASKDRIIEVGLYTHDLRSGEVGTAGALLDHGISIPRKITQITGIEKGHIDKEGVDPRAALQEILELISDCDSVWAYNAPFDEKFLRAEVERLQIEHRVPRIECVMRLCKRHTDFSSYKLVDVCRAWNIDPGNSHRAKDDAQAAGHVLLACGVG
jgi:DNA polymerase III epsilon subunit-like protein